MRFCGSAVLQLCGYAVMRLCGSAVLQLPEVLNLIYNVALSLRRALHAESSVNMTKILHD